MEFIDEFVNKANEEGCGALALEIIRSHEKDYTVEELQNPTKQLKLCCDIKSDYYNIKYEMQEAELALL